MIRNTIAKQLFEEFDNGVSDPEFPNYGYLEELQDTIEYSFNECIMSKDAYDSDNERINDLNVLARMVRYVENDDSDMLNLSQDQKNLVYLVVYNSHVQPDMLTDTELRNVIITLSNLAKLALMDYEY